MLNKPITIKNLKLNGRLVLPPMASHSADANGHVTNKTKEHYRRFLNNNNNLIILEHTYVDPLGKAGNDQLSLMEDAIEGLSELTTMAHEAGIPIFAQLNHAGAAAQILEQTLSSSAIDFPRKPMPLPRAMNEEDIEHLKNAYAIAAQNAQNAGFDGLEIHSAHGYLLNQFFSPLMNKREDKYNGTTIEGRIQLHLEILDLLKTTCPDLPIALRLGACDYKEGGTTLKDSIQAAHLLQEHGLDLLDISGGFCGYINPNDQSEGYFRELTRALKSELHIPILLTGGFKTRKAVEESLMNKEADLIGVGRAQLADPECMKNGHVQ